MWQPPGSLLDPSDIPHLPITGDFVLLKSLQVEEGSQAVITTENIKVTAKYVTSPKKYSAFHELNLNR